MKVEKIDHITIMVKDLEGAGKFFSDLFEFKYRGPGELKEADIRNLVCPEGFNLITPLLKDGPSSRSLAARGEGVSVISLKVPDLEQAAAEMKERGIRQIGKWSGARLFHPADLHGVMVELVSR